MESNPTHFAIMCIGLIETVIAARIELLPCSQDENSVGIIFAMRLFLFDAIMFQVTLG